MSLQRLALAFAFCSLVLSAPPTTHATYADGAAAATQAPEPIVPPTDADKAMVARALAAAKLDPGTPGTESMNFLMNGWPHFGLDVLSGKDPATEKQLEGARALVAGLLDPMEKGPTWPIPAVAYVPHANGPIAIDGDLNDQGWKNALTYHGTYFYNHSEHIDKPATTVRVTWDEKYLYFAFDCTDNDLIAPPLERDTDPFDYDSVEMFILPSMNPPQYWEVIVGPQGAIYDGLHMKALNQWGTVPGPIADQDYDISGLKTAEVIDDDQVTGKPTGYQIEVAVPFNQLPTYRNGRIPRVGDTLHIMLSRMDKHENSEDFMSVVPLLSWGHNIWNYIPIKLTDSNLTNWPINSSSETPPGMLWSW